jgi:DNA-binding MarR family transcriptional regulator
MAARAELEALISADLRAITSGSSGVGQRFARQHHLRSTDLHALLHLMVAETAGEPLSLGQLRERLDLSAAAVTYLVDRVVSAGHVRREADHDDRRKVLLRLEGDAMALGRDFFRPLGAHLYAAVADLPDEDLHAAHRVVAAMRVAMSAFEGELRA